MEKLHIPMPIVVEGKYDQIRLSNIVDGTIVRTDGFGIFNRAETVQLIRALAAEAGIIVLTDSDGAGTVIRRYISSALPKEKIHHLYIPQIRGKERRKSAPSKAGTLGVEGMDDALLRELLSPFAADAPAVLRGGITKTDFYFLGMTGAPNAAAARDCVAQKLRLPSGMTANALLGACNLLLSRAEFLPLAESALYDGGILHSEEAETDSAIVPEGGENP